MTIQWHLTCRPTADLLQVTGYLGDDALTRFTGAIGWAIARGDGPLLLDLTQLQGWSPAGRDAVTAAAHRLAAQHRTLELIAPPTRNSPDEALTVHPDLDTALTAHHQPPDEATSDTVWHTSRWSSENEGGSAE